MINNFDFGTKQYHLKLSKNQYNSRSVTPFHPGFDIVGIVYSVLVKTYILL